MAIYNINMGKLKILEIYVGYQYKYMKQGVYNHRSN